MNASIHHQIPDTPAMREIKINGKAIAATPLDPKEVTRKEFGELYTKRWLITEQPHQRQHQLIFGPLIIPCEICRVNSD